MQSDGTLIRVAATIVVHQSPETDLIRACRAIVGTPGPVETVRILVGSDPGGLQAKALSNALAEWPVHVTWTAGNPGFAGGQNRLLRQAFDDGVDVVIVHNPDLQLAGNAAWRLAQTAIRGPLAGPILEFATPSTGVGTGRLDSAGIRWTKDGRHLDVGQGKPLPPGQGEPRRVAGVSGACLAVSRAAYDHIVAASGEFFDEEFIAYREDAELALRAQLLGIESWLVPAALGLHVRSQKGTVRGLNTQIDLLGVRNRFLIAFKWGRRRPGWLPLVLLRDVVVIGAVLLRERSSLPGLTQAWRLRGVMRAKRRRVLAAVAIGGQPNP